MTKSRSADERAQVWRRARAESGQPEQTAPQHPLASLQRTLGNAQVARMLAQRQPGPEDEDEEGLLQAMPEVGLQGGPVSDGLAQRINSSRGGGATLEGGLRAGMEQQLGASFEDVRVHTGTESHALNRSISAQAFTTGSDIFLGPGASPSDHQLMAHELTHVVQQRSMAASGPMTVGPAGDSYEQQADAVAAQAKAPGTAQREPEEA